MCVCSCLGGAILRDMLEQFEAGTERNCLVGGSGNAGAVVKRSLGLVEVLSGDVLTVVADVLRGRMPCADALSGYSGIASMEVCVDY